MLVLNRPGTRFVPSYPEQLQGVPSLTDLVTWSLPLIGIESVYTRELTLHKLTLQIFLFVQAVGPEVNTDSPTLPTIPGI